MWVQSLGWKDPLEEGMATQHPAYLTHMQSTCEMLGWMNHKLESRLLGKISTTSDMQMIHSKGRK